MTLPAALLVLAAVLVAVPVSADTGPTSRPSNSELIRTHVSDAFGPQALARAAISAGIAQLSDNPEAWGRRWPDYGRRVASQWGIGAIDEGVQLGLAVALGHDARYTRRGDGSFAGRLGHAFAGAVVARNRDGRRVAAWSRLGGAVGASALSSLWYPEPRGAGRYIAFQSLTMLGGEVTRTVWDEFGPDVRRALLRR